MNFAPFGFPTKEPGNITRFGLFPEAGSYLGIRGGSGLSAIDRVLAVRRRDQEPLFAYPPLMSHSFYTEALNEIGDSI